MTRAQHIVYNLLEAGPDDVDPQHYIDAVYKDATSDDVNAMTAMTANEFYHRTEKNSDGSPARARRNGRTKTWKRQPGAFRIPVKHGMYDYFYIDNRNAGEWSVKPRP